MPQSNIKNRMMGVVHGRALIQPSTLDEKAREFDVVFLTEALVTRFGWEEDYDELLVCEPQAIRMDRAERGLPVLDCHRSDSVFHQVGRTVRVWIDDRKQLCARVRFSQRPEVEGLFRDIVDGIVKDISGGYEVYRYEREERPNGQRPIYRATDWMPTELSLAPVQADIHSEIRTGEPQHPVTISYTSNFTDMSKRTTMQYTVEGNPVKAGETITVNGATGVALTDGAPGDTITLTLVDEDGDPAPDDDPEGAARTDGDPDEDPQRTEDPDEDPDAATRQAAIEAANAAARQVAAESGIPAGEAGADSRARLDAILQSTRAAGLSDTFAITLFQNDKLSVVQCRQAIINHMARNSKNVHGSHGIEVGLDGDSKKRMAITNALLHRIAPRQFRLDPGAREYRNMTMMEIGKVMLAERGIRTAHMSKPEIASAFFKRSHSTSDFPELFGGIIDRLLRAQYDYVPEYWDKIARQTTVSDFRARGLYKAGVANGMKEIKEGGEIQYTNLEMSAETIQVATFGEGIRYTRQAFINDDLGVFETIPQAFVRHWSTLRGNIVWALLTANGKMSDGKSLFHADHKNLVSGALSETALAAAKTALMTQRDINGEIIRAQPRYLIVAPENEMMAKKLVTQTTPTKIEDVNVFAGAFDIIVEPRLSNSPDEWYLAADPNAVDSLYYAYLNGSEGLRVESTEEFRTDSMDYAVRGDFGAAAIDWRGIVKSSGK